jgi:hypothetical protein
MKIILAICFVLTLSIFEVTAQSVLNKKNILGKWEYSKKNDKNLFVECPDVLIFKSDGKYTVLNECYGNDGMNPIVETGYWKLNSNKKQLSLNRKFLINYYFLGSKKERVMIKILKFTNKSLTIKFGKRLELYERK